ncbi:MAG: ATP-binding protein [Xanthomonadales bacterium]|nr:ATP-binding protein [Xanthomonadales bacterium]
MKARLPRLSLRQKLLAIGAASSLVSLIVVSLVFTLTDSRLSQTDFLLRHQVLAQVTANNSRAPLAFSDAAAAGRVLAALESAPTVTYAAIHEADGEVLAHFPPSQSPQHAPAELLAEPSRFIADSLHLREDVMVSGRSLGFVYLQGSLQTLRQQILRDRLILLVGAVIAALIAGLLAGRLQRPVSEPIVALTQAADTLKRGGGPVEIPDLDDSDEIGRLTRSFKEMLSELDHRERALKESEANFRMLTEQASDGILVLDSDDRLLKANRSASSLLGYSQEALCQMRGADLVADGRGPLGMTPGDAQSQISERLLSRQSGAATWVETNTALLDDGRVQVILRDLSERKLLEMHLAHSQKMEAVGRLAGGIAHDFNNLLTVISGLTAIVMHQSGSERERERLKTVLAAAEKAADLTRQLLAFSRHEQHREPRLVDPHESLDSLAAMLERVIGETVTLKAEVPTALGKILVDPGQFEQIIVNLVVNARDAIQSEGTIRLTAARVSVDDKVEVSGVPVGDYVSFSVADDGCGINPELLEQIFEPFFTTKERGQGTGLGLATVYSILKQNDGHITVQSEPGSGSCFTVYFPQADEQAAAAIEPTEEVDIPLGQGERILLVEDDDLVREATASMLTSLNYRVFDTPGAKAALDLLDQHRAQIALVLTDLVMPGMNGTELVRRIVASGVDVPILLMSGYTSDAIREEIPGGLENVISKPFSREELANRVRSAVGQD